MLGSKPLLLISFSTGAVFFSWGGLVSVGFAISEPVPIVTWTICDINRRRYEAIHRWLSVHSKPQPHCVRNLIKETALELLPKE